MKTNFSMAPRSAFRALAAMAVALLSVAFTTGCMGALTATNYSVAFTTGCMGALTATNYRDRATHFENVQPNDAELAQGRLDEANKVIDNMAGWVHKAASEHMPNEDRVEFTTRMLRAMRVYRLKVANRLTDPLLAFGVLGAEIESDDAPTIAKLRELISAIESARRNEQLTNKTYVRRPRPEPRERNVDPLPNCVLATQPFPAEGQANPGYALRFSSPRKLYARCYTDSDLGAIPRGALVVVRTHLLNVSGWETSLGTNFRAGTRSIDFEVTPRLFQEQLPHTLNRVEMGLVYVWAPDNKLVVDRDGEIRIRPDWQQRQLARGDFVIDREN